MQAAHHPNCSMCTNQAQNNWRVFRSKANTCITKAKRSKLGLRTEGSVFVIYALGLKGTECQTAIQTQLRNATWSTLMKDKIKLSGEHWCGCFSRDVKANSNLKWIGDQQMACLLCIDKKKRLQRQMSNHQLTELRLDNSSTLSRLKLYQSLTSGNI